ncbi:MAG: B-box zinc finger protein [Holophagales bacterium]|nr:MAG: B-box zinc finger protein [Holophagales bacterium]
MVNASAPRGPARPSGDARPATPTACRTHPERAAEFRCDGCGAPLCPACIDEGHRLLFCRLCGERALPLVAEAPATAPARARERGLEAPYPLSAALGYPFRGLGLYLTVTYAALMTVLDLVTRSSRLLALGTLMPRLVVALLMPALLFAIVRTTAEGETELPDWPDFVHPIERLREWFWAFGVSLTSLLPLAALLSLSHCTLLAMVTGQAGWSCAALLLLGLAIATPISLFGLGATGVYESGWLSFRLDLHLRAMIETGIEGLRTTLLVTGLVLASKLASLLLGFIPLLGASAAQMLAAYTLFTAPHLVGLLFRRRRTALAAIYLG